MEIHVSPSFLRPATEIRCEICHEKRWPVQPASPFTCSWCREQIERERVLREARAQATAYARGGWDVSE